ncbi:MAG: outer membrane beta-barrel protein, partial [Acidobacteriia bacterium]|nr:outer membrane beta-barrel protein [Terriglobia bacterium]
TPVSAEREVLPPARYGSADDPRLSPLADLRPPAGPLQAQVTPPSTPAAAPAQPEAPPPVDLQTPFAYADYTWMNSVSRNHDEVLDGKYFSGEFRVDTNYMYDFEHPIDHSLIGTTEGERTGEFVIQALNVGGDFHAGNMQGRILTQFGAVSTAVPRNDASYSQGQWDLADAYRYLTEMYAGYHINVQHGLNLQVGDFLSFIGLFSYYSFDNWAYQPSYVSSNTPWFFTGMRAQWFPTNKLKIEPWLINGWQTYAKYNGREGVGGQILWRPTPNLDFVFNTYTLGRDVLGNNKRSRYHEDDSVEYKYYENPNKTLHRMAFSLTWDIGCETGGGVSCVHGNSAAPSQNFLGVMAYNRFWFAHDKFGATLGGGLMSNPGRYLVLLPPINGANATTGSPYFSENPGDKFRAYDYQLTFDYMPSQWVTWRVEFTQRGSSVPYFSGPGGITPQVTPGLYVNTGDPTQIIPGFTPDLRKQERRFIFSLMVKL